MILGDLSMHIQLEKINEQNEEKLLFPINTIDDVIATENGDTIEPFVNTVATSPTDSFKGSAICALNIGEDVVTDKTYAVLFEN